MRLKELRISDHERHCGLLLSGLFSLRLYVQGQAGAM